MSAATADRDTGSDGGIAPGGGGRHGVRAALSLIAVPVFLAGLYFSARTGIRIADSQVPPGERPDGVAMVVGSRLLMKGGTTIPVASALQPMREFNFRKAGSGGIEVEGVRSVNVGGRGEGWEFEILPGGDERYVRARWLDGDLVGEEFWARSKDVQRVSTPAGG